MSYESSMRAVLVCWMLALASGTKTCAVDSPCNCEYTETDYVMDCGGLALDKLPEVIPSDVTNLNLSANQLTTLDDDVFAELKKLRFLHLQQNKIHSISNYSFRGLNSLERLDLSYNQLEILHNSFQPLEGVVDINLSNNRLRDLPPRIFAGCFNLETLVLSNNKLQTSALDALNIPSVLRDLQLAGNVIEYIPYKLFSMLGELQSLSLRSCGVQLIDPNAFVDLGSRLQTLDLGHNRLQSVKRESFQTLLTDQDNGAFDSLALTANPIACDCGAKRVQDWLRESDVIMHEITLCTALNGSRYDLLRDDLTHFCDVTVDSLWPGVTPDRVTCPDRASGHVQLALQAVQARSAQFLLSTSHLPAATAVTLVIHIEEHGVTAWSATRMVGSEEWHVTNLTSGTTFRACALHNACALVDCFQFRTLDQDSPDPLPGAISDCGDLALTIGITVVVCLLSFLLLLAAVILVQRYFCKSSSSAQNMQQNGDRNEYRISDYSTYEAIKNDKSQPIGMSDFNRIHGNVSPLLPDAQSSPRVPDKKPKHFIRRVEWTPSPDLPVPGGGHVDRRVLPLPEIPMSSVRRREVDDNYLEPSPSSRYAPGGGFQTDPDRTTADFMQGVALNS